MPRCMMSGQRRYALVVWLLLCVLISEPQPASKAALTPPLPGPPGDALLARVIGPGLVNISGSQLAAAGWDLAQLDPERIQVWRRARQVAVMLVGAADGRFAADDQIRFLAGEGSRWSSEEVYWLFSGAQPGLRTALPDQPTWPFSWQDDAVYLSLLSAMRGDRWFAGELRDGGQPLPITLDLPAALPAGTPLELTLSALTLQEHRLTVSLLGQVYTLPAWQTSSVTAGRPQTLRFTLPVSLPAGAVTLEFALDPSRPDAVAIDRLSIPDLMMPLPLLTPLLELPIAADLESGGADQFIIGHRAFHQAAQLLVEARAHQGLTARIVDLDAIYARYSWGERDPEAIRAFLATVRENWAPAPASVLLLGAGGVRLREDTAGEAALLVPPYLLDSDPQVGEIACDTCYARLDSNDVRNDPLPDLAVGRLPVHNPDEALRLVHKIIARLAGPPPGDWRSRHLVVSDNDRSSSGVPDPAGPFTPLVDRLAALTPNYHNAGFVYDPTRPTSPPTYETPAELRGAFFRAFDEGAALLTYIGHGSPWQWAAVEPNSEPPYLVSIYDSARHNGARLPILLSMTCLSGQWSNPIGPSVDERLLLSEQGGVLASLSPAGSGVNGGHATILAAVLPALTRGQTLGEAMLSGLAALAAERRNNDLLYSYNLLGDPALRLPAIEDQRIMLPLVRN